MSNYAPTLGRGQSYPLENYKKGARVWHRHADLVWIKGCLQEDVTFSTRSIRIRLDDDETVEVVINPSADNLPFLCNPDILIGKDDLTSMSYLHEPAVLHNLSSRFMKQRQIYTYCGIVLVAINPYHDCSHLYGDDVIRVYRGEGKQVRNLVPHIYAVAEEAFFDLDEYGKCQSIIVSGESGAGKTVSAKFVMKYLATVASKKGQGGVEEQVLASNPIMEAIGNAKTVRNDNSSRFGKYIQMNFGDYYSISGAKMDTYLLEKSRLVFQAPGERNYHIFYQMIAARDHPMLKDLRIGHCDSYHYTNQGGDSRIPGVDDKAEFSATVEAFEKMGLSHDEQIGVFKLLAGILLLGNVDFEDQELYCQINEHSLSILSKLCSDIFNVSERALAHWLTKREIRAGAENLITKPLTKIEAIRSRDALSKLLYSQLFNYLVARINDALLGTASLKKLAKNQKFIGVLDIYGFETFECNSFEQFCINYANEKLQQQFNQHVFKLEQEEYEREELTWVRIEFQDNQPAIDLIEGVPHGLISYLDGQCKLLNRSDADWLGQISNCSTLSKNKHLELPRIRSSTFTVKHFASDVPYTVTGFMEKNKDAVSEQLVAVISESKCGFLRSVLNVGQKSGANLKTTVAHQFRQSLNELMKVLCSTRPHYVRCIKPNDEKESFSLEPKRAIQQLRACGVLETVRISAEGFPSRWNYDDFSRRYRILFLEGQNGCSLWRRNPKTFAEKACTKHLQSGKFALGKTKIFFRTGQVAVLERIRKETLGVAATTIQKTWRGYIQRQRYQKLLREIAAIKKIQLYSLAFVAWRRIKYLQMYRAAVTIQSAYRTYMAQKRYQAMQKSALLIQAHFRGKLVRQKVHYEKSVVVIQKYWRGYLVRKDQIERRKKIVKVQCCVRRWLAKRRLRELKIEARSVGHLQKLNTGLENKIIELQMKLDVMTDDRNRLSGASSMVQTLKTQLSVLQAERPELLKALDRKEELENEVDRLTLECALKDAENAGLQSKIVETRAHLERISAEKTRETGSMAEELEMMKRNATILQEELEKAKKTVASETAARLAAERETNTMREQLLENAKMLASPAFSRHGSMRSDHAPSTSGTSGIGMDFKLDQIDDLALISRQQRMMTNMRTRIEQSEREIERLRSVLIGSPLLDAIEKRTSLRAFESQKLQELETAYEKLKQDTDRLTSEKVNAGLENMNVQLLIERLMEENDRRREESIELRAMLSSRFERQSGHAGSPRPDSGHCSENNSDDGCTDLDEEICLERQCRQLKNLAENLIRSLKERDEEISKLERRLQESIESYRPSDCSVEETVRNVHGMLSHVTKENLNLNDKLLRQGEELAEARAQLRGYSGGLGYSLDQTSDSEIIRLEYLSREGVEHSALLEVFNVPEFSRILIYDLKPRLARLLTKCFPAYLLLTAFRFHDHAKDEAALTGLFSTVHAMLKDTVSRTSDLDVLSLWLVNSWRLLNLLRQYSGEDAQKEWCAANSAKQNEQRMQAFDVSPIREQLQSRVEDCYQVLMKKAIEPVLSPKIVPGVLQHESSGDLMTSSNGKSTLSRQTSRDASRKGLDDLLDFLSFIHAKLSVYGVDQAMLSQIFGQVANWICALALNHLMFRKELCNFEKAIQIKHNVTEIQSWLSKKGLIEHLDALEPLVQACHLLQSRKDESNLDTLCGEMTSKLKPRQVVAILQHYSPGQDFEERPIDPEFLIVVHRKLNEREASTGLTEDAQNALLLPGTYLKKFDCRPFVYSDFQLETLSLPSCLHLQQVCRLL